MCSKIRVGLSLLAILALMACATTKAQKPASDLKQDIVAVVNGEAVKRGEFNQELDSTYQRFHQAGQLIDGSMYQQLKTEVRESLINLILLDQHSKTLGIQVEEGAVAKYFQAAVDKYASKNAFKKSLKESGLTEADIKTRLKRTLAAQQVVRTRLEPEAKVADAVVRAYYDEHPYEFEHDIQVRAAHILINVHPLADETAKQKARKKIMAAQARLKAGEDFGEVARQHSEGPSKVNGGDIGYFGAAQMAPAFETAAFSLQPGEISDVVTTNFGYHLIKVYDRKPAGKETYEEAGPRLKARFEKERLNAALQKLVEQLKSEARIERFDLETDN